MKDFFEQKTRRVLFTLLFLDTLFVVLHLLFGRHLDLLNLDRERNFPTYYSGLKLILNGWLAFTLVFLRGRSEKAVWIGFAALFTYLSFDEISELHENIAYYSMKVLHFLPLAGLFRAPTHAWLFLFSPFIFGAGIFFFASIKRLEVLSKAKKYLYFGFAFFIMALCLEFIGGIITVRAYFKLAAVFEEYSEMIGATFMVASLFLVTGSSFFGSYHRIDQCKSLPKN
ncbi:hypothetical protein HY621_02845 [Candidatus Uhrbacteria bacterium]|nr:hypothetical protein [Candidatus Uhrbacteria bacterium]